MFFSTYPAPFLLGDVEIMEHTEVPLAVIWSVILLELGEDDGGAWNTGSLQESDTVDQEGEYRLSYQRSLIILYYQIISILAAFLHDEVTVVTYTMSSFHTLSLNEEPNIYQSASSTYW